MLVLHRAKLLASNQSVLALGVAPSGVRAAGYIVKSSATLFRQKFERGKIAKTFTRTTID